MQCYDSAQRLPYIDRQLRCERRFIKSMHRFRETGIVHSVSMHHAAHS